MPVITGVDSNRALMTQIQPETTVTGMSDNLEFA